MKIMICGSMRFAREMLEAKRTLEEMGHAALLPCDIKECVRNPDLNMNMVHCVKTVIDKDCFNKVAASDAILVLNYPKNGMKGYIGGATLMEIGLARHLDKKIFLLYDLPSEEELRYAFEIKLTNPLILSGDVSKISDHC